MTYMMTIDKSTVSTMTSSGLDVSAGFSASGGLGGYAVSASGNISLYHFILIPYNNYKCFSFFVFISSFDESIKKGQIGQCFGKK